MGCEMYLRAALYGEPRAFFEVGRCYRFGIGILQDKAIGKIWLEFSEAEMNIFVDALPEEDEDD
jgi:TPR repeat protein